MEPPAKRPRLSLPQNEHPDMELDRGRRQNDMLLKSRFEAIFEKYSQDFTGTGDEVDLQSGRIIVDNGHLAAMSNERDTGRSASPAATVTVANGRSMLRAMTVAPDRENSYFNDQGADDVIESIETIAGNAPVSDDDADDTLADGEQEPEDDDDDELFMQPIHDVWRSMSCHPNTNKNSSILSDQDSLFDVIESARSSSPDSLFEELTPPSADVEFKAAYSHAQVTSSEAAALDAYSDEHAIRARFGDAVGQEVVELLHQRDKAQLHIDPAWRIPVQLPEEAKSVATTPDATGEDYEVLDDMTPKESPNKGQSIWKAITARPARRSMRQQRQKRKFREESEDPLQEGFNSDDDLQPDKGDDTGEEGDVTDEAVRLRESDHLLSSGTCPFCNLQCANRLRVLNHLSRVAKNIKKGGQPDECHDPERVKQLRAFVQRQSKQVRSQRLFVGDFRTMVELHEGAGLSFADIRALNTLKTLRKDAMALRNNYIEWRRVENESDAVKSREGWSIDHDQLLLQLAQDPMTTMKTIHRQFQGLKDTDVGNRLAILFLEQLETIDEDKENVDKGPAQGITSHQQELSLPDNVSIQPNPLNEEDFSGVLYFDELPFDEAALVKDEGGDDDLFEVQSW